MLRRGPWELRDYTCKFCRGLQKGPIHLLPTRGGVKTQLPGGRATDQLGFCYVFVMKTRASILLMQDREPQ